MQKLMSCLYKHLHQCTNDEFFVIRTDHLRFLPFNKHIHQCSNDEFFCTSNI